MTERNQVWKCNVCGNIIEVLHKGADALVCCEKPMVFMKENSVDADKEKHVPVIEDRRVSVGSVPHPMTEEHYIEWIEATSKDGMVVKEFFNPGDKPVVEFCFAPVNARAYCNLHGLWKSK